jgi:hypothetical protein
MTSRSCPGTMSCRRVVPDRDNGKQRRRAGRSDPPPRVRELRRDGTGRDGTLVAVSRYPRHVPRDGHRLADRAQPSSGAATPGPGTPPVAAADGRGLTRVGYVDGGAAARATTDDTI